MDYRQRGPAFVFERLLRLGAKYRWVMEIAIIVALFWIRAAFGR